MSINSKKIGAVERFRLKFLSDNLTVGSEPRPVDAFAFDTISVGDKQIVLLHNRQPGGRLLRWIPACRKGGGGQRASITKVECTSHSGRQNPQMVKPGKKLWELGRL